MNSTRAGHPRPRIASDDLSVSSAPAQAGSGPDGTLATDGRRTAGLTILIPAYNEADHVGDTIRSVLAQTVLAAEVIVIDDCSTDATADVAAALGVRVLRPPANTGTKAGAQNLALAGVTTPFTMAIDADTILASDAVERILPAMADPRVAAACGFVLPRHVRTLWERGRYTEYLYSFSFPKQVQDFYGKPLISSGCFSVYRTDVLQAMGGWNTRTMAEDMDLTWSLYEAGWSVRFVPGAVCWPVEPADLAFMGKQLRRWSHGFLQNVAVHWRGLRAHGFLASVVLVACWDALVATSVLFVVLPLLAILVSPAFLLGYVVDLPVLLVPVAYAGWRRGELRRALASFPAFFVLRLVNGYHLLRALWFEAVLRRPLRVYEKGH